MPFSPTIQQPASLLAAACGMPRRSSSDMAPAVFGPPHSPLSAQGSAFPMAAQQSTTSIGSASITDDELRLFDRIDDIKLRYSFPDDGLRGTGGFGRVVVAKRTDGSQCALKVIGKQHGSRADLVTETTRREVSILRELSHPAIVALYAAIETPTAYYLDFELCKEDAFMFMLLGTRSPRVLNEAETACVVSQLAEALAFLHHRQIAHLDVKLENILVNDPRDVRLADFGFSRQLSKEATVTITNGSGLYTPPEVLKLCLRMDRARSTGVEARATPVGFDGLVAMDMWCLGVVTFLLLSGKPPYRTRVASKADQEDMLKRISNGLEFPESRWADVSDSAKDFVKKLLCEEPYRRPSALAVLTHPFLQKRSDNTVVAGVPATHTEESAPEVF